MSATRRPFEQLQQLAQSGATGELICAASQVEIHVYLQGGRIAWATDSRHAFAFASHLQTIARIDPETLRQVVEECRRDRLPLGETLVEWGLATWDAVRTSLAHQIALAVDQLAALDGGQTLFLERTFAPYNERLVFDFVEFFPPEPEPASASAAQDPDDEVTRTSIAGGEAGLARQIRASIEGLSWVEVLEGECGVDGDPACPSSRVPLELVRATLLDASDFVAIRSARTSIVGARMARSRSLWCRLSADATFGGVVSAIASVVRSGESPTERSRARTEGMSWTLGDSAEPANAALAAFLQRAQEGLAAVILDATAPEPIAGLGCSRLEPELCVDVARRRGRVLVGDTVPLVDAGEQALDSIGISVKTMVSGESRLWCFGAELAGGESLWLFLDRRSSQGLGWAYLTALTRSVSRARGSEA